MDYGFEDPMDQEEYDDEEIADNGRHSGGEDSFMNKSPAEYLGGKKSS
jgi:hypothetical protein